MKTMIDFDFEQTKEEEYKLMITLPVDNESFKGLMRKAVPHLKKKGIEFEDKLELIEKFEVPENMRLTSYPIIKNATKRWYRQVSEVLYDKGFNLVTNRIDSVVYKREKDGPNWLIDITFVGFFEYMGK